MDYAVSEYFALIIADGDSLDVAMQYITETGDVVNLLMFSIIMLIAKRTRKIGISLLILLVVTTVFTGYIKCGIDRDRPDVDYSGPDFPIPISTDTYALFCDGSFFASYPSGHAARTMVYAVVLGFALSQYFPRGCYLILIYPIMISLSRVYLLQHYPMDVVGGLVIGMLLAGVIAKKTKLDSLNLERA